MRLLLHALPLLVVCLLFTACSRNDANSAGLTPSNIEIKAYYGHRAQRLIDFRLDGQPLEKAEVTLTVLEDASKAFDLTLPPLSEQAVLTFQTDTEPHPSATFGLHYRGHDYTIHVAGTARSVPTCEVSSDICIGIAFNMETEACERVLRSDVVCDLTDCANPGVCRSGVCVHQEIEHAAPTCPSLLPITELKPVWARVMPSKGWPDGPLVLDEDGNSYCFKLPTRELRSFSSTGSLRWTVSYSPESTGTGHPFDIRVVGGRVFVFDRESLWLRVFDQVDGWQLWEQRYWYPMRILPAGNTLWLLWGTNFVGGAYLNVVSASSNDDVAFPEPPRLVDGYSVNYYDLIADGNQRVILIGTDDVTNPTTTTVAAVDASTYVPLWATTVTLNEKTLSQPVAVSGSTLLFQSGLAVDVTTKDVYPNDVWQQDLGKLGSRSLALNPDASGFVATTTGNDCLTTVLSHANFRTGTSDWDCFLGAAFAENGVLRTTPAGSAVLLTVSGKGPGERRPSLRIIDADGREAFHGVLTSGQAEWPQAPLVAMQGQRLLLSQQDTSTGIISLVAYDIPELLTK